MKANQRPFAGVGKRLHWLGDVQLNQMTSSHSLQLQPLPVPSSNQQCSLGGCWGRTKLVRQPLLSWAANSLIAHCRQQKPPVSCLPVSRLWQKKNTNLSHRDLLLFHSSTMRFSSGRCWSKRFIAVLFWGKNIWVVQWDLEKIWSLLSRKTLHDHLNHCERF